MKKRYKAETANGFNVEIELFTCDACGATCEGLVKDGKLMNHPSESWWHFSSNNMPVYLDLCADCGMDVVIQINEKRRV